MLEDNVLFLGLHNLEDLRRWLEFFALGHYMQPSLTEILVQTRHRRAALPHDRVFAILGLVPMEDYPDLKPDYQLSPAEVFTRVAKSAMEIDRDPSLLCLAGYTRDEDLVPSNQMSGQVLRPSWTPDFGQVYLDICRMSEARRSFPSHGGDLGSVWSPVFNNNKLHVEGQVIGKLTGGGFEIYFTDILLLDGFWSTRRNEQKIRNDDLADRGASTREGDLVCQFDGCVSPFVIREMPESDFMDTSSFFLPAGRPEDEEPLNCFLVGPCAIRPTMSDTEMKLRTITFVIW